jgi:hypothetical protein
VTTRRRTTAAMSVLAAAAVALAGCSANAGNAGNAPAVHKGLSPQQIVLAANEKVDAAETARMIGTYEVTVPGQPATTMKMNGVVDAKTGNAEITTTLAGFGDVVVRMVDRVVYSEIPTQFRSATAKQWVKLDMAQVGAAAGGFGGQNPADQLDWLSGLTGVTEVGKEKVGGVSTTHYRGSVDFTKAAEAATDPSARKDLESMEKALGGKSMPAEVWIDEQGLPRKMAFAMTATPPAGTGFDGEVSVKGTVTFSDFGTPVRVSAPSASEVSDMADLVGGR